MLPASSEVLAILHSPNLIVLISASLLWFNSLPHRFWVILQLVAGKPFAKIEVPIPPELVYPPIVIPIYSLLLDYLYSTFFRSSKASTKDGTSAVPRHY